MEVVGPSALVGNDPLPNFPPLLLLLVGAVLLLASLTSFLLNRTKEQKSVLYKDILLPSGNPIRVPVQ